MKKTATITCLVATAGLAACTPPDPSKIAFPDQSPKALVLMKVEPANVGYVLQLARFNEPEQALDAGSFGGFEPLAVVDPVGTHYVARLLDPGTYVIQDFSQQAAWAVCFNEKTRAFTVAAGDAVFLGDFSPILHLAQLETLARTSGQTLSMNNQIFHYFDNIIPPRLSAPTVNSPDFLAAKQYEAASMPTLHGRLKPVVFRPARFGTGYSLFGQRVCGGYFKDKVKPPG